jgi:hypothetical protein
MSITWEQVRLCFKIFSLGKEVSSFCTLDQNPHKQALSSSWWVSLTSTLTFFHFFLAFSSLFPHFLICWYTERMSDFLTVMRVAGVRRVNAFKNTGYPNFAFSSLQVSLSHYYFSSFSSFYSCLFDGLLTQYG